MRFNELRLSFHGAATTVTGSRYLLERDDSRVLIDCGLFQGYKQLRLRNWAPLPFDPRTIAAVVLTHAHIQRRTTLAYRASTRLAGECPRIS